MTTLVFTATYNERDNIERLVPAILAQGADLHLLVVDDASPDGTGEALDRLAAAEPRLIVLHRPGKLGLGSAHRLGMQYAARHGYQALITMDADWSHDPAAIPALLAALDGRDFVVGSRFVAGGSSDYRGWRRFLSWTANNLARLVLRLPVHEFTTSYRAFRIASLRDGIRSPASGYTFFLETSCRICWAGLRVAEVPIQFRDRLAGVSKIPRLEIFNGGRKLLDLAATAWLGNHGRDEVRQAEGRCPGCGHEFLEATRRHVNCLVCGQVSPVSPR